MRAHEAHVLDCLTAADKHHSAAAVALLARRDEAALAEAAAIDASLPLAGDVLTVKALFDVAGWVTHAGSSLLADAPPATVDAPLVSVLRRAGALLTAQTNMTEFAYGALGLNDTYGTPVTPLLPGQDRVSGGSTSGGAVAVALRMADIALGSDTSGSVRIPAAFCGVAGFKPSRGRYPDGGMLWLSPTFDVPGIIARSADDCRRVDAAITCRSPSPTTVRSLTSVHAIVPSEVARDQLDPEIEATFGSWCSSLANAGARVTEKSMPCLTDASAAARDGGVIAAEAYMLHREWINSSPERYDHRVGPRIALGQHVLAHQYIAALRRLRQCADRFHADLAEAGADLIITPTVSMLPPRISDLVDYDTYLAINIESFRLTEFANRLDLPSISIPGDLAQPRPYGLLLTGQRHQDDDLLDIAAAMEAILSSTVTR